jgi:hypothetical protein
MIPYAQSANRLMSYMWLVFVLGLKSVLQVSRNCCALSLSPRLA